MSPSQNVVLGPWCDLVFKWSIYFSVEVVYSVHDEGFPYPHFSYNWGDFVIVLFAEIKEIKNIHV